MKKYPEYKDSDNARIGKIPFHWSLKRLKRFARIRNGQDQKNVLNKEGKYPIFGTGGIFGRSSKYLHNKPSVLLGRKGTIDNPIYIDTPFWTVDTLYYTEIFETTIPKFFYYLCKTINFDKYKTGSAVPSMTQEDLNEVLFTSPPLTEQTTIASFLDQKTQQIDDLIAKKQRLIELLKEERTAVINQAVTRGLDPTVPMKDSGIEWLGEVPEHWEVKRIKHELNNFDHIRVPLSSEERGRMIERIYDYYGASGIIDKVEDYLFDGEYILIGEDGANLITRNSALAFKATGKFWVNNHAHILKPYEGNIDYFTELLEQINYSVYISGSAQPKLTQERLANIPIPVPPISEQSTIIELIKEKCGVINKTIETYFNQIKLIQEYKTSLINEAVTGKTDIRDYKEF